MTNTIVARAELATEVGRSASRNLVTLGGIRGSRRRHRRHGRTSADDVVAVVGEASQSAIVLIQPPEGDEDDATMQRVVDAVGAVRITLPDDLSSARWCVAIAAEIAPADHHAVVRALEVLCNGPDVVTGVPRRSWGPHDVGVPALRPVTLARWASCAWVPCSWCARGGADAHPCRRCGAPIRRPVAEKDRA